jgi:hypothetical protein
MNPPPKKETIMKSNTGSYSNGSTEAAIAPTIGVGKGIGRLDVQSCANIVVPIRANSTGQSIFPSGTSCLRCERGLSEMDVPRRFTASAVWVPQFVNRSGIIASLYKNWQISTIVSAQSGRPFSPYCSAPSKLSHDASGNLIDLGCDYNMDGGGITSGFYDRPDAPAQGAVKSSFKQGDFINGLYSPTVLPQPVLGTNGTLGRDVYRGPRQTTTNLALGRNFSLGENRVFQFRADAFNSFNNVNLFLPNSDLALAPKSDGTYSNASIFGKSKKPCKNEKHGPRKTM